MNAVASTILVLIAVNILGYLVVYLVLRNRIRRTASASAQIAEIREEVNRLVIELNQTADRNISLIEDKIASLTELLSKTDKKMTLLKRESEKHEMGTKVYSNILESKPVPAAGNAAPGRGLSAAGAARDGQAPAQGQGRTSGTAADAGSAQGRASVAPRQPHIELVDAGPSMQPSGPQDLRERVVSLFRAGLSASLIAFRVGAPLGEVELIIALERQRESS
jgi:hypothetical protein